LAWVWWAGAKRTRQVALASSQQLGPPKAAPQHLATHARHNKVDTDMNRTNRNVLIGLGILLFGFLVFSTMGGMMMGRGVLFGYGAHPFVGPWLWGIGFAGLVIRLALWGVLIMLALRFFRRWSARSESDVHHSDLSSLEILRRRYAAGEISREQFEEMRRVLDPTVSPQ
jgi:putative membrane protein